MTLVIFILILSVLVLVHEFGHFFVAKKLGIRVEEFGLGLPPRLFGKRFGETVYSLNALPFGGFVKVTGEDPTEETSADIYKDTRSFMSRKPWQRIAVLIAGVCMNLVLAVALFYIVLFGLGFKTAYMPMFFEYRFPFGKTTLLNTVITSVESGSAADKAGFKVGEAILEINSEPVGSVIDVRRIVKSYLGKEVSVLLLDVNGDSEAATRVVNLWPQADKEGNPVLGVYLTKAVSLSYSTPVEKALSGPMHSFNVFGYSISSLKHLIVASYTNKSLAPVSQSVSGPVGIYHIVGGVLTYGGKDVILNLLDFVAIMSLSLAFMNILPIPALDGGRVFFVILEVLRGKPLSPKVEGHLHKVGFILMMGLLVLVTIKDLFR